MKYKLSFLIYLLSCAFSFIAGGFYWEKALDRLPLCFTGIKVVDGDTLKCEGRNLRLYGFDTPEARKQNAPEGCKTSSVALGRYISTYVKKLINEAIKNDALEIIPILTGRRTYKKDRRRRPLVTVKIHGRDLALLLKEMHFAKEYYGGKKPNWCAIIENDPQLQAIITDKLNPTQSSVQ